MPGREYSDGTGYRYGFNGKEKDDEVKGEGNQIDYGARGYDPRIGRWLSLDVLESKYPSFSGYSYAGNNPIYLLDPDGKEVYPDKIKNTAYWAAYNSLLTNPTAKSILLKFQGNSDFNLTFQIGKFAAGSTVNAHHKAPVHVYSNSKNQIVKQNSFIEVNLDRENIILYRTFDGIDYKYTRTHTDLDRFVTLLHEVIHSKVAFSNRGDVEHNDDHNYFADHHFDLLIKGITEFAKSNNLDLSSQEIKEAAFIGLEKTNLFKKYVKSLSEANKTSYEEEEKALHVRMAKIEFKTVATKKSDDTVVMDGSESDKYNIPKKKE